MVATAFIELIRTSKTFEVLDYHDGPWLQSVVTRAGHLMLAMNVEDDEAGSNWLYVDVSNDKYAAIRSGRVSVYSAFKDAESGFVYKCRVETNDGLTVDAVASNELSSDVLPTEDWKLNLGEIVLPPKLTSAREAAELRKRQVFDLAIRPPDNSSTLGARVIADVINGAQALFEALACDQDKHYVRIPGDARDNNVLYMTALYDGSFGMRFEIPESTIFSLPENNFSAARFSRLISLFDDPELLVKEFEQLNLLTRSRFIRFLRLLSEKDVSMKYEWASLRGYSKEGGVQLTRLRQNIAYLDARSETSNRRVTRHGFLNMVDVTSGRFTFVDDIGDTIRGHIDKKLLDETISKKHQVFPVPWRTTIEVDERIDSNPVTGLEKWTHIMVNISDLPALDGNQLI